MRVIARKLAAITARAMQSSTKAARARRHASTVAPSKPHEPERHRECGGEVDRADHTRRGRSFEPVGPRAELECEHVPRVLVPLLPAVVPEEFDELAQVARVLA